MNISPAFSSFAKAVGLYSAPHMTWFDAVPGALRIPLPQRGKGSEPRPPLRRCRSVWAGDVLRMLDPKARLFVLALLPETLVLRNQYCLTSVLPATPFFWDRN